MNPFELIVKIFEERDTKKVINFKKLCIDNDGTTNYLRYKLKSKEIHIIPCGHGYEITILKQKTNNTALAYETVCTAFEKNELTLEGVVDRSLEIISYLIKKYGTR